MNNYRGHNFIPKISSYDVYHGDGKISLGNSGSFLVIIPQYQNDSIICGDTMRRMILTEGILVLKSLNAVEEFIVCVFIGLKGIA